MKSKAKPKPTFKSEAEEAAFWASHDSTGYVDYSKSRRMIFPKLNKRDVPYQTLLKLFLLERVQAELHLKNAKAS
jgi:hypothetical protein